MIRVMNRRIVIVILAWVTAVPVAALAGESVSAIENTQPGVCVSSNADLGDSALWSVTAVELFSQGQYQAAIRHVDACFSNWAVAAGHVQKAMFESNAQCPKTGRVSKKVKARIQENYLINDVSMALWAKARSLHELGEKERAVEAYTQCVYMACGRAWDPKGWFWSPAEDCAKQVKSLL